MHRRNFIPAAAILCLLFVVSAFVFPHPGEEGGDGLLVKALPLPGEGARDFEVAAVVGEEIKKIRLSDFHGKWVYLTFIPAAFTFV